MADTISVSTNLGITDLGNATSETQFTGASSAVASCQIPVRTNTLRKPLRVVAGGRVQSDTAQDFTAKLYFGNSSTIASNARIFTSVTSLAANIAGIWLIDVTIGVREQNASDPGTISLAYLNTSGTLSTAITTTNPSLNLMALSLTGQFASTSTANSAFVDFFEIQGVVS